jgi:hypothetical protein
MTRNILAVVAGVVGWLVVATLIGLVVRSSWPAYAAVAETMTFTLPMMIARLAIGAVATLAMGYITARITQSPLTRLIPGVLLLLGFIPQHIMLWDKFPLWYHLTFLLSLVPLTYAGARIAGWGRGPGAASSKPA